MAQKKKKNNMDKESLLQQTAEKTEEIATLDSPVEEDEDTKAEASAQELVSGEIEEEVSEEKAGEDEAEDDASKEEPEEASEDETTKEEDSVNEESGEENSDEENSDEEGDEPSSERKLTEIILDEPLERRPSRKGKSKSSSKAPAKSSGKKSSSRKLAEPKAQIKKTGQFGKGHTVTKKKLGEYIVDDIKDFSRWCKKNYAKAIPLGLLIVLVIIVVTILIRNAIIAKQEAANATENNVYAEVKVEKTLVPIEQNAYENVNQFFDTYYEACGEGDLDTYAQCRNLTDETEKIRMAKKASYIDYYQVVDVYTKPGYVENTYIAYVYYEVKFKDYDSLAPGMNTFILGTSAEGNLFVDASEQPEEAQAYIEKVSSEEDVTDLFNKIQVTYNDIVDSDEELKIFLEELAINLKNDVGEEIALLAASQEEDVQEEEFDPSTLEEQTADTQATTEGTDGDEKETVSTTDRVNVRASASQEATKLGTVAKGTTFERLENLPNGWSKIMYEGQEGYIRNDFLVVVETPKGYVKASDNVNVRKEPSTDGEKLGSAKAGTILGLLEHQADGWSRIIFNGQSAYIKTEYLEEVAME